MRFTWTFLAGAAVLSAFVFTAPIQAPSALAQFSSAPDDASNPILQLPAPPGSLRPPGTRAPKPPFPTLDNSPAIVPVSQTLAAPPKWNPRFAGQQTIRVGLSTAGQEILVYFPGGAALWQDKVWLAKIDAGEVVTLAFKGAKSGVRIRTARQELGCKRAYFAVDGAPARLTSNGKNPKWGRPYRGDLEIFPQKLAEPIKRKGPLALVNVVPLESYLLGVVPWEMSPGAPLEALKAQAICARTKALDFIRSKRFAKGDFEICDYDACQGYPGTENEKPATTKAVESTKSLAIYSGGRPIDAVYSTNSGGVTANARDVWPGKSQIPYLQSVADFSNDSALAKLWEGGMTEGEWAQFCAQDFDSFARPDGVDSTKYEARKYRWNQFVSVEAATKAFVAAGFGKVTGLEVAARAPSGRIRQLRVRGVSKAAWAETQKLKTWPATPKTDPFAREPENRELSPADDAGDFSILLEGDGKIRAMFSKQLGSTTALPSSLFTISPATDASGQLSGWNLQGAGWGHGVGLCQRGAQNHARQGWDARKILGWYYRGVQIR